MTMKTNLPKRDRPQEENESAVPIVLVGTYREVNAEWIRARKCYNLPLPDGLDATDEKALAFHRRFTHVVLYSHDHAPIVQRVRFAKVIGQKELIESGYKPPKPPHQFRAERYALYEFTEKAAVSRLLADPQADVFVVSSRCPSGLKIDADFYAKPLPDVGGQSIPNVFEKLKPYFKKWHSAVAFNPVQLDFFASLGEEPVPFPAPEKGKFTFIDLFAGVGGIRMGFQNVGGKCVFSSEWNSAAADTYLRNFGETPRGDIQKINENDVPDHDVLCAGFPCQPFSISGRQKGFDDTRGTMFFELCRIVKKKMPSIVFLENVKHLVHHDHGRTLQVILNTLKELGYNVAWKVLNGVDFGVSQNRERIIIVGARKGLFNFDTLKKQPRKMLFESLDKDGDFEFLKSSEYTLLDNPKRQEESGLMFAGYRNKSIRKVGVRPGTLHLSRVHKQPNRIYSVHGIHPTLPSQESSGRYFIRLTDDRVRKLTLSECWRIMGFPENFVKVSAPGEQYKQLGNSVCVPMITAVASEIYSQLLNVKE